MSRGDRCAGARTYERMPSTTVTINTSAVTVRRFIVLKRNADKFVVAEQRDKVRLGGVCRIVQKKKPCRLTLRSGAQKTEWQKKIKIFIDPHPAFPNFCFRRTTAAAATRAVGLTYAAGESECFQRYTVGRRVGMTRGHVGTYIPAATLPQRRSVCDGRQFAIYKYPPVRGQTACVRARVAGPENENERVIILYYFFVTRARFFFNGHRQLSYMCACYPPEEGA